LKRCLFEGVWGRLLLDSAFWIAMLFSEIRCRFHGKEIAHRPIILLTFLFLAPSCLGQISSYNRSIIWNGHKYFAVKFDSYLNWQQCKTFCEQNGGYLATIQSSAENDMIFTSFLKDDDTFWDFWSQFSVGPALGGYKAQSFSDPAIGWVWVDQSPWNYTNWSDFPGYYHNPDNTGGIENCLHFWSITSLLRRDSRWNDVSCGPLFISLIMEMNTFSNPDRICEDFLFF
jgi:hypothetical protein